MISAIVLATEAHHDKAVRISVEASAEDSDIIAQLSPLPGWKEETKHGRRQIAATFEYDPKTQSLSKGTLPNKMAIKVSPNGQLYLGYEDK